MFNGDKQDKLLAEISAKLDKLSVTPEGADCPVWRAPCKKHGCRWWTLLQGKHPQTGEQIDDWNCAVAYLPILVIEGSQNSRATGAAVESFRNEMVRQNEQLQPMLIAPPEGGSDD